MDSKDLSTDPLHHWTTVAAAWEERRDRLFEMTRPVSERLVDEVADQPGQTLLELTAGPGETGFLAAERVGGTGRVISSDFVPEMVEAARRGAAARGVTNVEFRVLDAQDIDLPDESVDGVLSRYGVMLVPDQPRAMAEARRVLRPGGRLAYATWGPPDRNPWIFQLVMALMGNGLTLPGDPFSPGGVFSLSTPEPNEELASGAGFDGVAVDEVIGSMNFDDAEDYWTYSTAIAGPLAELVASLSDDQLSQVRATLDAALQPFERHDGVVELPWSVLVTTAS